VVIEPTSPFDQNTRRLPADPIIDSRKRVLGAIAEHERQRERR
jgi:hypothetical protein